MNEMVLWDFRREPEGNLIQRWVRDAKLTARERAILGQRLDRLKQMNFSVARGTALLEGPFGNQNQVYKLAVGTERALWMLLCPGPLDEEQSLVCTLLLGGSTGRGKSVPRNQLLEAERRREEVLHEPKTHRESHGGV